VQDEIYDDLLEILIPRAQALRLGDPFDEATDVGPVACIQQFEKILGCIETGKTEGAHLLTGGARPTSPDNLARGLFVPPTLFGPVSNSLRIAREEVFGPVACVIRFDDAAEAARIANDSPYGLAAGVWTEDMRRAYEMVNRIRAGTVWVNDYRIAHYTMPFGGFKESGIGREQGIDALHDYTEVKSVWFNFAQLKQ
jgi:aldehyde dehydrogenase (NAD+)